VPTYQYSCTECGEPLEVVQKFTDDPLTACPACGGRLRKVFNSVGIVFKGSGFYRTDSRNGASTSAPATAGADGSPAGSTPSSDSAGSGGSKESGAETAPKAGSSSGSGGGATPSSGAGAAKAAPASSGAKAANG
jgi:putative FmdB family regulatory protein